MSIVVKDGLRFYQIAGKDQLYPSVTTVLDVISKPHLGDWKMHLALGKFAALVRGDGLSEQQQQQQQQQQQLNREELLSQHLQRAREEPSLIVERAATFGTLAHDMFETLLREDQVAGVPPDHVQVVRNFVRWRAEQPQLTFTDIERVVYSDVHGYAGAVDAVGQLAADEGRKTIVVMDWKTSNRMQDTYAMQVAAYAAAYEENTGTSVDEAWVVRFDKRRAGFELRKVDDLKEAFDGFLAARQLWDVTKNRKLLVRRPKKD